MDKGAHYYRCDFQVHTPRDRQWTGQVYVTDEERNEYASRFIAACREKSLDAVAITDHHDLTFAKYIREAAKTEVDNDGNPVPEDRQIRVFPGIELTLNRVMPSSKSSVWNWSLYSGIFVAPIGVNGGRLRR